MSRILGIIGVFCLLVVCVSSRFPHIFHEIHSVINRGRLGVSEPNKKEFLANTLLEVNRLRSPLALAPMTIDSDIQAAVDDFVISKEHPGDVSLKALFGHLQSEFPGAQFLSANVSHSLTDAGLIESIALWEDATSSDYNTLSSALFMDGHRLGCVSVLAQRLPEFDVSSASSKGGRYFNRCPHCHNNHAVELSKKSRTLILACPDCKQPYDVLAADTHGVFYRANDFLLGFELPLVIGSGVENASAPSKEHLLHIWRTVVNHCEYENDNARTSQREAWKTPDETWLERSGDCEDTSILLVDSLISAGFEARVAIGWNQLIGQHAWCVAKVGDEQFVLESTIANESSVKLLTAKDAADEYQPEQLFDRSRLYFRQTNRGTFLDDYWDESLWKHVDFPKKTTITEASGER